MTTQILTVSFVEDNIYLCFPLCVCDRKRSPVWEAQGRWGGGGTGGGGGEWGSVKGGVVEGGGG